MLNNSGDMQTRPRWQNLLIAFTVIFGLVLIILLFVNRWLGMPVWMIAMFSGISAFLIINKFFAHKIF